MAKDWVSKSSVLFGLCGVLLVAALNRHDPMVYGMFLFLIVVSVLGFVLPWLSLRSMTLRLSEDDQAQDRAVQEGESCELKLRVERKALWPAFMVDVETEWQWGSRRIVLRETIPVVRAGKGADIGREIRFPCRGHYKLTAMRLSSGFPLGLIHVHHTVSRPQCHLRVWPKAKDVQWPLAWDATNDPVGLHTTRRLGQSFELGVMRPYQFGESVGRVSWRASARAGELIIQHFQQSGARRLRVLIDLPIADSLGDPDSAGEQAVRLAAGLCMDAMHHDAQLFVYLPEQTHVLRDKDGISSILHALSQTQAQVSTWFDGMDQMLADAASGEQLAVVVQSGRSVDALMASLRQASARGCHVAVCVAASRRMDAAERSQVSRMKSAIEAAGLAVIQEQA